MYDQSQLLKGTVEGCILKILQNNPNYGYNILILLNDRGFESLKEGTIYPILTRLEKKGLIQGTLVPSDKGPSRKSYALTKSGEMYYQEFFDNWKEISNVVNDILYEKEEEGYEK